jgi:hypothetical protein
VIRCADYHCGDEQGHPWHPNDRCRDCAFCLDPFPKMVDVFGNEGSRRGRARLLTISVSEAAARWHNLRVDINPHRMTPEDHIEPGRFMQLYVGETLMMSDTPTERRTSGRFVRFARGDVLIAGLGMGMVLMPVTRKPEVTSITVVEIDQDVIDLVGPVMPPTVQIVRGNIDTWRPPRGTRYDTIFLDIWPTVCGDYYDQITSLKGTFRRYRRNGAKSFLSVWREREMRIAANR